MALKTCNGKVQDFGGTARTRKVWITPSQPTTLIGSPGLELPASPIGVTVAADGTFAQPLQANADLSPAGTYYTLTVPTGDAVDATFAFVVPQSAGPFDISQIGVVPSAPIPPAAQDSLVMHLAQVEHVTGQKIYDTNPVFNAGALPESAVASLVADLATLTAGVGAAAVDSTVLHKAGAETVTGVKHFSAAPVFDAGFSVSAGAVSFPANSIADAALSTNVDLLNAAQAFTAVKTFTTNPVFNANAIVDAAINSLSASKLTGANTLPDGVLSTNVDLLNGIQTITAVKTFSAAPVFSVGFSVAASQVGFFGTGDNVPYYVNGTAWQMDARQGTAGSPIVTGSGPTFKISRTESIPAATMPSGNGQNNQGNAGLWVAAVGDASNQVQVSALLGTAGTASTQTRTANIDPDSCAVQGLASVTGSGVGTAIGAYLQGRRDTNTGKANGAEARSWNQTLTDGVYNSAGFSDTIAFWASASGTANSAVAFSTGAFSGQGFIVGIGFTAGSVITTTFRDDTSSTNSIIVNGTHTIAFGAAAGAGGMVVGGTSLQSASALFEVQGPNATTAPLAAFGSTAFNAAYTVRLRNTSGLGQWAIAAGAGDFLTGSAAGDTMFLAGTSGKALHFGGTTKVVTVTNANTLGFFAATPVAKQSAVGTATGYAAGTTAVTFHSDDTYTGNTGATAYTINGIVAALKTYGLLTA